ncbi:restriction endonuclease subunit S [Pantanalinema rosaneae CENA516]|uniref:restriction endonuclease subunit S n=1 Tax=Pantanalinema rosaneae TaxID=1620701 RepID=UPI003D6F64AB
MPDSWKWLKLGNLVESMNNGLYKPARFYSKDGIACVRMFNIQDGQLDLREIKRVIVDENELETYKLVVGDLVVNRVNSRELVGKAALVQEIKEPLIYEAMNIRVRLFHNQDLPEYINLLFRTNRVRAIFQGDAKQASGQASVSQPQVASVPVPLPPIAEQKRIVEKCDRLLVLCDEIEKRQQQRQASLLKMNEGAISQLLTAQNPDDFHHHWQGICNNFDLLYSIPETIPKLRQASLQLAVQGKLVPQNPTDDAASILFERIETRKEALIKQKIIKKASPLPPLDPENIPYLLPENWMWVRLDDINDIGTGSTPLTSNSDYYLDGEIPWITSTATSREFIDSAETYITETAVSDYRLRLYPPGSLIVALYGQGRTRGQISQLRISATIKLARLLFFLKLLMVCKHTSSVFFRKNMMN